MNFQLCSDYIRLGAEDFTRDHPLLVDEEISANRPPEEEYSDSTSLNSSKWGQNSDLNRQERGDRNSDGRLSKTLEDLPDFNKMSHFAANYDKPTTFDQSLGEFIQMQSRIPRPPKAPQSGSRQEDDISVSHYPESDQYDRFRNDARSASTPIPQSHFSDVDVSPHNGDSGLHDENNLSSFTVPLNVDPPAQRTPVSHRGIFSSNCRENSPPIGPESNIINLLQEKAQRELRVLPHYSTPVKVDGGNYKVICKIEFRGALFTSTGFDKSREVAKRKSAENMIKNELGVNNNLLRRAPKHDEIEFVSDAKEYFLKHLRNNRNRTLHSAFDSCSNDDGRSGTGNNML